MVRLGLSDSMRSTVSVEDMASLNTATDHQSLSRPDVESVAKVTEVSDEHQTQTQTKAVLLNPLRHIRGGLLAFILLFVGIKVLSLSINTWMKSSSNNGPQFERLERSIELLGRDTSKLEISANRFLHSVQEAHVAGSGRTEKLQNIVKQGFEEQMKMQIQENEQVMHDVLQYYRQQEKKIMETRERLMKMNITLPVEVAVRAMPEALEQVRQKLLGQEEVQESSRDGIVEGPPSFSEKSSLHDNDVQEISNERRRKEQSMSYGSLFFYIVVIGSSAGYLWNAVSDAGKTKLVDEKWEWSPIPTILTRLKELIGSVVVVEDLRSVNRKDETPEHIEHIEF